MVSIKTVSLSVELFVLTTIWRHFKLRHFMSKCLKLLLGCQSSEEAPVLPQDNNEMCSRLRLRLCTSHQWNY